MNRRLSKSKILSGRQCLKRLYLEVHRPDLLPQGPSTGGLTAVGHDVHDVARNLHPGGTWIAFDPNLQLPLEQTRRSMNDPECSHLFEATFQHEGVLVRCDLLFPRHGPRLVEVKASTKLKDYHLADCAIQAWVLERCGLERIVVELALVDSSFVYAGDGNYQGLFRLEDVTLPVEALKSEVPQWVGQCRSALSGPEPQVDVGSHCGDPYACPFIEHCAPAEVPYPVSCLPRGGPVVEELLSQGIKDIRHIPADYLTSALHERVRLATVTGQPFVDPEAGETLRNLEYPRYYLDFETINRAVPMWVGTRPYQQQPFQWSCHVETGPGQRSHRFFLDSSGIIPFRQLAESLLATLGDSGPIFTYSGFERQVVGNLAGFLPDMAPELRALPDRFVDLLTIARHHYYHREMKGSWSIKSVLPTIAPELNYGNLPEVSDGTAAQQAYLEIINPETEPSRREVLLKALSEYCELDTWAMVRIADFFVQNG